MIILFSRLWPEKIGFVVPQSGTGKNWNKFLFAGRFAPTNRRLLDRKLIFDFVRPFDLIQKYGEKCEASPATGGASEQPIAPDFEKSFIWSHILDLARTYFERKLGGIF